MDRNQVIGFALLALLLIGYLTYNQHEQTAFIEQKKADSISFAKLHPRPVVDSSKAIAGATAASDVQDSLTQARRKLQPSSYYGQAQTLTLENKKLNPCEQTHTQPGGSLREGRLVSARCQKFLDLVPETVIVAVLPHSAFPKYKSIFP